MAWSVLFHPAFEREFRALAADVQDELGTLMDVVAEVGPVLGRPSVDTLRGSRHRNMKELRFNAGRGVWRAAFAFDSERQAIVLVAGDKRGRNERQFYRRLIRRADERFDDHLQRMSTDRRR